MLTLIVKLRVFVSFRVLLRRVPQLSQTLLGSCTDEVGEHIVDFALRID